MNIAHALRMGLICLANYGPMMLVFRLRGRQSVSGREAGVADYAIKPLSGDTWPAFARLVERHGGIFGGCWCMGFHAKGEGWGALRNRTDGTRKRSSAADEPMPRWFIQGTSAWAGVNSAHHRNCRGSRTCGLMSKMRNTFQIGGSPASFPEEDIAAKGSPALRSKVRSRKLPGMAVARWKATLKTMKAGPCLVRFYSTARCPCSSVRDLRGKD